MQNRLILDSIILAQEMMHSLKQRKTVMEGVLATKIDMSKAFDRVSWTFLRAFMSRLGFDQQ